MRLRADFVVIGSGIAGLRAAITSWRTARSCWSPRPAAPRAIPATRRAGIAAALGPDDSADLHRDDTLEAGAGLCDRRGGGDARLRGAALRPRAASTGAPTFDRDPDGAPALGREGAHSVRRVLHARDATGREIARTLWQRVARASAAARARSRAGDAARSSRTALPRRRAVRLDDGRQVDIEARAVLLATGGAGQVFRETTNPHVASGDGLAMAWRAGRARERSRVRAVSSHGAARARAPRASSCRKPFAAKARA